MSRRRELRALIEAALAGAGADREALAFMGTLRRDDGDDVKSAAHALIHFFDDHDIRARDAIYDRLQRDGLREWVRVLAEAPARNGSARP